MSVKILNVLCEGQTEELFCKEVLKPHLKSFGVVVKHQLLITNKKQGIKGGIISYSQVKRDLQMWIKQNVDKSYETHFYTTMLDFYALPNDFPGYSDIDNHWVAVENIESAFSDDIKCSQFIPYIQMHEFEALVFCGLDYLIEEYPQCEKEIKKLKSVLSEYDGLPENINNSRHTAPSKQIIKALEGKYWYDKPKSGAMVTSRVGIEHLREKCQHFDSWICRLKQL